MSRDKPLPGRLGRMKWLVIAFIVVLAILIGLFAATLQPRKRLVWSLPRYVSEAIFSQDGQLLITNESLDRGSLLTLWASATGTKIRERAFDTGIAVFAVSPDESRISAVTETGTLASINVQNLEIENVMYLADPYKHTFHSIVYSSTGRYICIMGVELGASPTGFARIYDAKTNNPLAWLEWPQDWPDTPVAFNADGTRLAIGTSPTYDQSILRVWDTSSWKEILNEKSDGAITALAWSPDGNSIAVGRLSFRVDVLHSASLSRMFSIKTEGGVHSLTYSPDGCFILFSGSYVSAQIWESSTGKQVINLGYGTGIGLELMLSPKGNLALISDYNFQDRPSKSSSDVWDISDFLRCSTSGAFK